MEKQRYGADQVLQLLKSDQRRDKSSMFAYAYDQVDGCAVLRAIL